MIYAMRTSAPKSRLGVTVSRKVGHAAVRNRIKRRIREAFRRHLRAVLPRPADLVVIARAGSGVAQARFAELDHELGRAISNFGLRD